MSACPLHREQRPKTGHLPPRTTLGFKGWQFWGQNRGLSETIGRARPPNSTLGKGWESQSVHRAALSRLREKTLPYGYKTTSQHSNEGLVLASQPGRGSQTDFRAARWERAASGRQRVTYGTAALAREYENSRGEAAAPSAWERRVTAGRSYRF